MANYFRSYVYLIFAVKIIFIFLAISHIYLKSKGKINSDLDKKIEFWKERTEFVFIILMSFFLIYLFNPRYDRNKMIDKESKFLLYLFGFILIITADWSNFLGQHIWLTNIRDIFGIISAKKNK